MIVATYDTEKNQQINCNCKQYEHELLYIKSWKDIETQHIVFCVDRQAAEEELKYHPVYPYDNYIPPHTEFTLVFGLNHGMNIGQEALDADKKKVVEMITIPGKVLWAESAMAIILEQLDKF